MMDTSGDVIINAALPAARRAGEKSGHEGPFAGSIETYGTQGSETLPGWF